MQDLTATPPLRYVLLARIPGGSRRLTPSGPCATVSEPSMASIFGSAAVLAFGGSYVENKILPDLLPSLFEASNIYGMPKAAGLVVGALSVSLMWATMYGFKVGGKRKHYREKARKDGEKDVDQRYMLPNLYVDGNTVHSRAFNCVQRSPLHGQRQLHNSCKVHQHRLWGAECDTASLTVS